MGPCRRRRHLLTALSLVGVLTLSAGCGLFRDDPEQHETGPVSTVPGVPTGSSAHTLVADGQERGFRLYRPTNLAQSTPAPLVVMLHGALGTGSQAESSYGWNAQADRKGFVVAYPDGLSRSWAVSPECCGPPARDGVNDVAFIQKLVATVADQLPVDRTRIYATGISNGGMLAYRLACDTTLFAAIGPVAATQLGPCSSPAPISVIHVHGMADQTVPLNGGPGKRDNDGTGRNPVKIDGPPIPDLLARWRTTDGCGAPATTASGPVRTSVATCPEGRAVELATIDDAGHQWPGATGPRPEAQRLLDLDPPATALDATETIWRFFEAHPRTGG
ncbi:alpha/beta hydrolase family esterase [Micromonospora sp. NPDC049102]|uniref:extracellular catalytic domain type 1 short-chain-length polyhydroxyalkanoate depolymerase n=1 Tax=Micromonospora sp. NPDC049102 TaxID=3364265 RepID=UPI003713E786